MATYRHLQVTSQDQDQCSLISSAPPEIEQGQVLIEVDYSALNYKDALAVTGKGKILKSFPLTPGIDVAGTVILSRCDSWVEGQRVFVTGQGLGEHISGGFAELVVAPTETIIEVPESMSSFDSMILGTAGFTAAIAVHRLLVNDQSPDKGPLVVTGASGGVGMIAINILAKMGFKVLAVTGKKDSMSGFLTELGASEVLTPDELELGNRPLESVKFGGAIDNVGGEVLAGLLRHTALWGNIASIGLAESAKLDGTVMPQILRGVSLLGISSANCPWHLRKELWRKLAQDYRPANLDKIVTAEITLEQVIEQSQKMIARETVGRTIVKLKE